MNAPLGPPLSLPESFVVLEGARADPHEVVFLTLLELVVVGSMELLASSQDPGEFVLSSTDRPPAPAPIAAIADVLARGKTARTSDGRSYIPTLAAADAFSATWTSAAHFVHAEVWRALVARGLITTDPNLLDSLFVVDVWHLTPEGHAERRRLHEALAERPDWQRAPATALLRVQGRAVPSEATFDAIDELEDQITPADAADPQRGGPIF